MRKYAIKHNFGKPKAGAKFGREFEPSGRYVIINDDTTRNNKGYEYGETTFINPLVVDNDGLEWKKTLSEKYGGLTGKELSKAVIADGYDGIITTESDRYISEIVDLTVFD